MGKINELLTFASVDIKKLKVENEELKKRMEGLKKLKQELDELKNKIEAIREAMEKPFHEKSLNSGHKTFKCSRRLKL